MKNFILIAVLLLLFWSFKKISAAKGLDFEIVGIKTVGDLLSAKIILQTKVNNPTDTPVYIDYISANVLIDGKIVGKVEYNERKLLQPGINDVSIPVLLAPLTTAGVIFDIIAQRNSFKVISLEGKISFEGVETNIKHNYPLLDA